MGMQWGFLRLGLLRSEKKQLVILNNISSLLTPGRFTLLLGPPASGKSTLLKLLAGKLQRGSGLDVRARACYPTLPYPTLPYPILPYQTLCYVSPWGVYAPSTMMGRHA